jgi:dihydroorotate dehydrogenase
MELTTNYLGLRLKSPLVPSASPLSEDLDNIKRMEDAGAAAIVLYSVFEEQIRYERYELHHHLTQGTESYPEALSYFPDPTELFVGVEDYLRHIERSKASTSIPIIASLNGSTLGGWTDFAKQIEQAGADALELNLYNIPTDLMEIRGGDREAVRRRAQGGEGGGDHPGGGEGEPVLHQLREHRQAVRRRRRERAGAVQPVLPAGHRAGDSRWCRT